MRRSALLAYHARGVRAGRSRSYRLRGGRETVRRRNGRNCAWWIGAKLIAATRVPITAVSVQGEPGNGRSWEECFYSDASRVRIAEKPVAVVAVPPPLFIVCCPCAAGTSCCERSDGLWPRICSVFWAWTDPPPLQPPARASWQAICK
eukprot:COSAG01_NODE_14419_length_1455_cov_27.644543_1_plen_148_part_00